MASDSKIILHAYYRSSASYRVRIGLNTKGLDYSVEPVHLLKNGGEQLQAAHKELNPMGEVPVLIYKGKAMGQSLAILQFLEEEFPEPRLFGRSPTERARIVQLCENVNAGIQPLQNLKVLTYLEKEHGFDQAKRDIWSQHWINLGLTALNTEAEKSAGPFMMGAELSAVEIFLIPQLFTARRFKTDLSKYPALLRIEESCLKLDSFKKAHPHRQVDTPDDVREA